MDEETKKKVEATVLEILRESLAECKVRAAAADRKLFVRGVFDGYIRSLSLQEDEEEEHQHGAGGEGKDTEAEGEEEEREYDDMGDLILCRLATNRRVTLQEFRGKMLVSIRESYSKDGKELPSSKGVSLTVEQWEAFRDVVPAIEDAIKKLGESD